MPEDAAERREGGVPGFLRASAATLLLFLSGLAVPIAGPFLALLTPQPGLRLVRRTGTAAGALLVAIVAATIGAVAGSTALSAYGLTFGLITIALPLVLEREWSIEVTVGLVSALVATAGLAAGAAVASPADWFTAICTGLEQTRDDAVRVYSQAGLPIEVVEQLEHGSARIVELVMRLLPALLLGGVAIVVLLNLELLRRRQRRAGAAPVFGDLTRWKSPPELVWVLIASGYASFLPSGPLQSLAMNAFVLLAGVYFCQGLVIAQFYMRRWHSPIWVNGLVYLFIVVEWLFATGVTLVGLFDLWADFRRLDPRPVEED
jgi:uncharacterized protein YybS (DUF2232 family)